MALNFYELKDSQEVSKTPTSADAKMKWIAFYSNDYSAVYSAALLVAPRRFSGYARQKIACNPIGGNYWMVEVDYGYSAVTADAKPDDTTTPDDTTPMGIELSFDITAQQIHITQSLKTVYRYQAGDNVLSGINLTMSPTSFLKCQPAAPDTYTANGADVGKYVMIADDPILGWTAGNYKIVAFSAGYWQLNASPARVGTAGGRWGYTSSLTNPGTAPNYKQAIGATIDKIEGTDIFYPHFEWTFTFQIAPLYQPYLRLCRKLCGKVNGAPFRGWAKGEVLYLGCTGQSGPEGEWKVTHKFACGENLYAIALSPEIMIPFKEAWQYLWCNYGPSKDAGRIVQVPISAYVEQVYQYADFTLLGIGG